MRSRASDAGCIRTELIALPRDFQAKSRTRIAFSFCCIHSDSCPPGTHRLLVGVGWILLGIVLFMQRGLGVDALAVVGLALVVNGAADALTAPRGWSFGFATETQWAPAAFSCAGIQPRNACGRSPAQSSREWHRTRRFNLLSEMILTIGEEWSRVHSAGRAG